MKDILHRSTISFMMVAAFLGATFAVPQAKADAGAGAVRLSADIPVLAVENFPDASGALAIQLGVFASNIYVPNVGVGLGYQVTDEIVIGARLGFGIMYTSSPSAWGGPTNSTAGLVAALPYFEYLFGEGSVRPFIGAQAGFQGVFPEGGSTLAAFIGGAQAGVHVFATDGFSITPALFVNYVYAGEHDGLPDSSAVQVMAAVSFEGWID